MELRDLIGALEAPMLMGADNVDITNIQSDSRRVTKGSLFVAVRGTVIEMSTIKLYFLCIFNLSTSVENSVDNF